MRGRVPRDRAGALRALGVHRGAARDVLGRPGRMQRGRHLPRRAPLRPGGEGMAQAAEGPPEHAPADDPVLGVQPLRRPRRVRQGALPDQRPGQRPPDDQRGGVRPRVHRGDADVRAGTPFPAGRDPARPPVPDPAVVARREGAARVRDGLRAAAGPAGPGPAVPHGPVRGLRALRARAGLGRGADRGPPRRGGPALPPHLAQGTLPAAALRAPVRRPTPNASWPGCSGFPCGSSRIACPAT